MKEMGEYVLKKLKKSADDVIVQCDESMVAQVKFSNNKVSTTQRWINSHISIFASFQKKTVATMIAPDKQSADNVIAKLPKFASSLSSNNDYHGLAEGPFKYNNFENFDRKIKDVDMCDVVSGSINSALENGAERASGVFETEIFHTFLLGTNNVEASDSFTRAYFSIRSLCKNDGSGQNTSSGRRLSDVDFKGAALSSSQTAVASMNPSQLDEGNYDVFFEHLPAANLLENAANSSSIFNVESGLSFFSNRLGKKVASESFCLNDDATVDWGINSRKHDDEGVPCKKTKIIENGVLKNYLHNTSSAFKYKTKTTASAGILAPRPINPIVEKGNLNKDDMICRINKGLLVTNLWYTRFQNYTSGNFSTIPRDGIFLIEKGKITRPIKGIRINDSMLRFLGNIIGISRDSRQMMGWELDSPITVPQLLVKNVAITKSSE